MKLKSVLKNDVFYFAVFASMTLLPLSSTFNYLRVAIMGIMFALKCLNINSISPKVRKLALYMLISPIIPIIFVMIFDGGQVSWGIVTHEYMRMIFAAFAICTASKCRVSFKTVYIICACVLLFNLAIQILQKSGNSAVYDFIKSNYVQGEESGHLDLSKNTGEGFRGGSIFVNPNVYMVIPLMCLGVFYQQKRIKDSPLNMAMIAATLVSCYLTGSRTSIITAAAIIVVYYFVYDRSKLLLAIPIGGIALYVLMGSDIADSRAFRISESDAGSLTAKLNGFVWYWQSANPIYWITGSLGSARVYAIDCEWGHIYNWYGLFGYYWYIKYYKHVHDNLKSLRVYSIIIVITMALVAFTAGVLLVMQAFPLVCMLGCSDIYVKEEVVKNK